MATTWAFFKFCDFIFSKFYFVTRFDGFLWVFDGFSMGLWVFDGFYGLSMSFVGFIGFFDGFCGFFMGFLGLRWVLWVFNGFCGFFMGFMGHRWVLRDFDWFYAFSMGFWWILRGFFFLFDRFFLFFFSINLAKPSWRTSFENKAHIAITNKTLNTADPTIVPIPTSDLAKKTPEKIFLDYSFSLIIRAQNIQPICVKSFTDDTCE